MHPHLPLGRNNDQSCFRVCFSPAMLGNPRTRAMSLPKGADELSARQVHQIPPIIVRLVNLVPLGRRPGGRLSTTIFDLKSEAQLFAFSTCPFQRLGRLFHLCWNNCRTTPERLRTCGSIFRRSRALSLIILHPQSYTRVDQLAFGSSRKRPTRRILQAESQRLLMTK